jgi:DNA-binding NtrC family response regulator
MSNKVKILIVEDEEQIRQSLATILTKNNYQVETTRTGQEAVNLLATKFFNLTLLDIKLPDIEGTKLLKKMHKNVPEMVKIMMTGYPSLENAVEALNLGADAYIIKPIDPATLLQLIKDKLAKQQEEEEITEKKVTEWVKTRARKIENNLTK